MSRNQYAHTILQFEVCLKWCLDFLVNHKGKQKENTVIIHIIENCIRTFILQKVTQIS